MNNELLFQDEPKSAQQIQDVLVDNNRGLTKPPWTLLVVDDEESVHQVTRLALRGLVYDDRPLSFLSAHSAAEARVILEDTPGIAVVLLDVVMETDHAGLDLARYIRKDLGNHDIRIVLRTGQPGQAPEMKVIADYDINDYKDKTELTAQKLYTLLLACLRSYRDIEILQQSRVGLHNVMQIARGIYHAQSFHGFLDMTLERLSGLLNIDHNIAFPFTVHAYEICEQGYYFSTLKPQRCLRKIICVDGVPGPVRKMLDRSVEARSNQRDEQHIVMFCHGHFREVMFVIESPRSITDLDRQLAALLTENLNIALENLDLNENLQQSQRDIIYRVGEMVETHSQESCSHVHRVALYSELLAKLAGLPDNEVDLIKRSAPLHDVGKIGIPDRVLKKRGPLNDEEWEVMKGHSELGYKMLAGSGLPILDQGAIISRSHHEHWDGSGYPRGLKGEEIPVVGRITALADVFDALGTGRCYKDSWNVSAITAYIEARSGRDFDPEMVRLFRTHIDQFIAIREMLQDDENGDHSIAV
ncbi:MAG: HD domain-containing phosphohydrolase [Motiliproteus sp.]